MTPSLWARVAAAIDRIVAKLTTEPLRPTISPGPLPVDGRPAPPRPTIPFPAPPPPGPVTPPVGPANPPDASRAALIAATTARFIEAHNPIRATFGLHPYLPDARPAWSADETAQENAANFEARGKLDHYAGGKSTPWTRMAARGVPGVLTNPALANECLAEGYPDEVGAVAGWLDEPAGVHNHRENVLSPIFTHIGGSVAWTPDGRPVWCVDYCRLG